MLRRQIGFRNIPYSKLFVSSSTSRIFSGSHHHHHHQQLIITTIASKRFASAVPSSPSSYPFAELCKSRTTTTMMMMNNQNSTKTSKSSSPSKPLADLHSACVFRLTKSKYRGVIKYKIFAFDDDPKHPKSTPFAEVEQNELLESDSNGSETLFQVASKFATKISSALRKYYDRVLVVRQNDGHDDKKEGAGSMISPRIYQEDVTAVLVVDYDSENDLVAERDEMVNNATLLSNFLTQSGCRTHVHVLDDNDDQHKKSNDDAHKIFEALEPKFQVMLLDVTSSSCVTKHHEESSSSTTTQSESTSTSSLSSSSASFDVLLEIPNISISVANVLTQDESSSDSSYILEFAGTPNETTQKFMHHVISSTVNGVLENRNSNNNKNNSNNISSSQQFIADTNFVFLLTPTSDLKLAETLILTMQRRMQSKMNLVRTFSKNQHQKTSLIASWFDPASSHDFSLLGKFKQPTTTSRDKVGILQHFFMERASSSCILQDKHLFFTEINKLVAKPDNDDTFGDTKDKTNLKYSDLILSPYLTMKHIALNSSKQTNKKKDNDDDNNNNNNNFSRYKSVLTVQRINENNSGNDKNSSIASSTMSTDTIIAKKTAQHYLAQISSPERQAKIAEATKNHLEKFVVMIYESTNFKAYRRESNPTASENFISRVAFYDYNNNYLPPSDKCFTKRGQAIVPNLDGFDVLVIHGSKEALLLLQAMPTFNFETQNFSGNFSCQPELLRFLKRGGKIWCTAVAEYAMSGFILPDNLYPENLRIPHLCLRHQNNNNNNNDPNFLVQDCLLSETTSIGRSLSFGYHQQHSSSCSSSTPFFDDDNRKFFTFCTALAQIFRSQVQQAAAQYQTLSLLARMDATLMHMEIERNGIFVRDISTTKYPRGIFPETRFGSYLLYPRESEKNKKKNLSNGNNNNNDVDGVDETQEKSSSTSANNINKIVSLESLDPDAHTTIALLAYKCHPVNLTQFKKHSLLQSYRQRTDIFNRKKRNYAANPENYVIEMGKYCNPNFFFVTLKVSTATNHSLQNITEISVYNCIAKTTFSRKIVSSSSSNNSKPASPSSTEAEGKSTTNISKNNNKANNTTSSRVGKKILKNQTIELVTSRIQTITASSFREIAAELAKFLTFPLNFKDRCIICFQSQADAKHFKMNFEILGQEQIPHNKVLFVDAEKMMSFNAVNRIKRRAPKTSNKKSTTASSSPSPSETTSTPNTSAMISAAEYYYKLITHNMEKLQGITFVKTVPNFVRSVLSRQLVQNLTLNIKNPDENSSTCLIDTKTCEPILYGGATSTTTTNDQVTESTSSSSLEVFGGAEKPKQEKEKARELFDNPNLTHTQKVAFWKQQQQQRNDDGHPHQYSDSHIVTPEQQKNLSPWISFIITSTTTSNTGDENNNNHNATVHLHDGCIHQEIRLCNSSTGRTASRLPNCQVIPKDNVLLRQSIVSRFGPKHGWLVEFDFKQLEVTVQALLTQDENMLRDLANNIDFHLQRCCNAGLVPGNPSYEDLCRRYADHDNNNNSKNENKTTRDPVVAEMRQKAKLISFQSMYGASVATLARSAGLDISVVERMMMMEDKMYPCASRFHQVVKEIVASSSISASTKNDQNIDDRFKIFQLPTGGRVAMESTAVEKVGPIIKNYPIQSYAAELMSIILGKLFRKLLALNSHIIAGNNSDADDDDLSKRIFVVNFVHDSIWLDCHECVVDQVVEMFTQLFQSIDEILKQDFPGAPSNVKFSVTQSVGSNLDNKVEYVKGKQNTMKS